MVKILDLIDQFIDDPRLCVQLKTSTRRAYRCDLHTAGVQLHTDVDMITSSDIAAFLDRSDVASTTQRRVASLRKFYVWAIHEGYCETSPLDHIDTIRATRRLPRPITSTAERERLERAIAQSEQPHRLIFTILRETGMRVGEVIALNLGDVQLDTGREALYVREPKNNTERVVVLGSTATPSSLRGLRAMVRERPKQPLHSPLFLSNRGTRISYDSVHYQWNNVCITANVLDEQGKPRYTIHQLRHTRATELIEQGQRMEIVQRILGHRDPRSTQGYAELSEMAVREALEAVQ